MVSIQIQIVTRIRIHNLELRIRIRQKVPDPCGSESTILVLFTVFVIRVFFRQLFFAGVWIRIVWDDVGSCAECGTHRIVASEMVQDGKH
jgi:hypothetical protein